MSSNPEAFRPQIIRHHQTVLPFAWFISVLPFAWFRSFRLGTVSGAGRPFPPVAPNLVLLIKVHADPTPQRHFADRKPATGGTVPRRVPCWFRCRVQRPGPEGLRDHVLHLDDLSGRFRLKACSIQTEGGWCSCSFLSSVLGSFISKDDTVDDTVKSVCAHNRSCFSLKTLEGFVQAAPFDCLKRPHSLIQESV